MADALAVLNRALHARRIATADPLGGEVGAAHALVTRVGYGTGEEVAEGLWTVARELPAARAADAARGRAAPAGAVRGAARGARRGARVRAARAARPRGPRPWPRRARPRSSSRRRSAAARAELAGWRELDGMPARLDELAGLAAEVAAVAAAARAGGLDEPARAVVGRALGRLEAALRARTAGARF